MRRSVKTCHAGQPTEWKGNYAMLKLRGGENSLKTELQRQEGLRLT
jgi:hypothetical protein